MCSRSDSFIESPNCSLPSFFFFNDTATTEIYTLSLHDALPISPVARAHPPCRRRGAGHARVQLLHSDRKSTRLNSSHLVISYAVFCLKKKNKICAPSLMKPPIRSPSYRNRAVIAPAYPYSWPCL